jgi:hypothetical protein
MTKPRSVAATANDNSIPGSRIENESLEGSKLVDGSVVSSKRGGTLSADQVSYTNPEDGVERSLSS